MAITLDCRSKDTGSIPVGIALSGCSITANTSGLGPENVGSIPATRIMENEIFKILCKILDHKYVYEDYDDGVVKIKNWKKYCKFCFKIKGQIVNDRICQNQQTKKTNS